MGKVKKFRIGWCIPHRMAADNAPHGIGLRIFKRSQVVQIIPITFDSSQSSQYWHACERLYLEYCHHRQRLPLYSDIEQNPHSKIAPSRGYLLAWKKSMYHGKMAFSSYFFRNKTFLNTYIRICFRVWTLNRYTYRYATNSNE